MRHVIVNRVSALILALLLLAAVLFVRVVTPRRTASPPASAPPAESRVLFEWHCASCHEADDLRPALTGATPERRREIEEFLLDHGDAPGADDRHILDWLAGKTPQEPR